MTENTMPLGEVSPTSQVHLTSFSQVTMKRTEHCQHWFACCDCLLGKHQTNRTKSKKTIWALAKNVANSNTIMLSVHLVEHAVAAHQNPPHENLGHSASSVN